jgi:hypothetical protein
MKNPKTLKPLLEALIIASICTYIIIINLSVGGQI